MRGLKRMTGLSRLGPLLAAVALICGSASPAAAQGQPGEQKILDALQSRGMTRSITRSLNDSKTADERRLIDGLRTRSARSITIEERTKVAEIVRERPNIDLEINFDFNSATVGAQSVSVLLALGRVLSKDELKGTVFLIKGHTDGKGSAEYNQDLSERRAEAVKRLLVLQFNLPAKTLIAMGYGKNELKNPTDPFADENRRVQIVNTELK